MPTARQLVEAWILNDPKNAVDAILSLASSISVGQRNALRNRIRNDLKARNAQIRANFDDSDADGLSLD